MQGKNLNLISSSEEGTEYDGLGSNPASFQSKLCSHSEPLEGVSVRLTI